MGDIGVAFSAISTVSMRSDMAISVGFPAK